MTPKSFHIVAGVIAIVAFSYDLPAQRCIGPKDNSGTAQTFGVDPIAPEDITWCDDFDSYCSDNEAANSHWPGYPLEPDNVCSPAAPASGAWFREDSHWPKDLYDGSSMSPTVDPSRWEGWDGNPGWITTPYTVQYQGGGNSAQYHEFDMTEAIGHKFPGFNALDGTDQTPLVLRFWMYHPLEGAPPNSPLYLELKLEDDRAPTDYVTRDCLSFHDCNCAALNPEAYCQVDTCEEATCQQWFCGDNDTCEGGPRDGQGCVLSQDCGKTCNGGPNNGDTCSTNTDCGQCVADPAKACDSDSDCGGCVGGNRPGGACDDNHDCQWACGPDQDTVCDGGPHNGTACSEDSECAGGPIYPIVSQQWLNGQISVPHPALDTEGNWASLAFGMLAQLDRNPCDQETGRKPTMYHAATFNGNRWYDLRSSVFPGQGDFNYDWKQAFFELKVKTATVEIKLVAGHGNAANFVYTTSTATLERRYQGPFNRIGMGTGPGCELDPTTGECLGEADVWRYPGEYSGANWHPGYVDRVAVLGGVPATADGACCLPDGSCEIMISTECAAAGGLARGVGSTCEGGACLGACCEPKGVCSATTSTTCNGNYRGIGTSCSDPDICPCPTPFADFDEDGDVDVTDFGGIQRCLTLGGGPIAQGCECFDTDGNTQIDATDVEKFVLCGTGGDVPWVSTPACP